MERGAPGLERHAPCSVLDGTFNVENIFESLEIAGESREEHTVDHANRGLLLRIQAQRDAIAFELENLVARELEHTGKRLETAPQHALLGDDAESAIRGERFFQADELLGLIESAAGHLGAREHSP